MLFHYRNGNHNQACFFLTILYIHDSLNPPLSRMANKNEFEDLSSKSRDTLQLQFNKPSNYKLDTHKVATKTLLVIGLTLAVVALVFYVALNNGKSAVRQLNSSVAPSTPRPVSTNVMEIEGALSPKDYSALDGRFRVPTFKRDNGQSVPIKSYRSFAGMVDGCVIDKKRSVIESESPTKLLLTLLPKAIPVQFVSLKTPAMPYRAPNFDDYDGDDDDGEYLFSPDSPIYDLYQIENMILNSY